MQKLTVVITFISCYCITSKPKHNFKTQHKHNSKKEKRLHDSKIGILSNEFTFHSNDFKKLMKLSEQMGIYIHKNGIRGLNQI